MHMGHGSSPTTICRYMPKASMPAQAAAISASRRRGCSPASDVRRLMRRSAHEGAFDDEVTGRRGVAFLEAQLLAQALEVAQHLGAAADHHAVFGRVEHRQAQV